MAARSSPELERASPTSVGDPLDVLRGIISLRRLIGLYPDQHPLVRAKIGELETIVRRQLQTSPGKMLTIDLVRDDVYVDGAAVRVDAESQVQFSQELVQIGVQSLALHDGVTGDELRDTARFLWEFKGQPSGDSVEQRLAQRGITHVSLAKIVPLDTRWQMRKWAERPSGPMDPAYEESLLLAQEAFDSVGAGKELDRVNVRDLVELLVRRVAHSNAALGQVLAVKQYENLTYIHSVNVAMLSLLIGREIGLDDRLMAELAEGALLHDIGKTRVPLDVVRKPGKLDSHERRQIEAHAAHGGEILAGTPGLRPLTPTLALEHHRTVRGGGYPDLGTGVLPHPMSQIVSVADVYEAITGARTYKDPTPPERACLILARVAGDQLSSALVKAFINTITFYPMGSLVRTSLGEMGIVVRTSGNDPLHPVVALLTEDLQATTGEVNTSERDASGAYARHIVETVVAPEHLDRTRFLEASPD